MDDFKEIAKKWQKEWEEAKVFEPEVDENKSKFFLTVAYPYINALLHLGHCLTYTRPEILARFKRMLNYNVLWPQGWHATGAPIVGAALKVREKDEKQIKILKECGIEEKEIPKFENPEYWVFYFSAKAREAFKKLGFSVDWRREFFTTYLNKGYSKFIEWQYRKLKEKGFIVKGKHPVVWDPKVGKVIGDHDRPDEFAGIQPQETILIKFRDGEGRIYPCSTFRPETVYGVTNLWVNPAGIYVEAKVDGERWVVSKEVVEEIRDQEHEVEILKEVGGKELLGKEVTNPVTKEKILILPAKWVDVEIGTGLVMSVPAHAPWDWIGLEELKKDETWKSVAEKIEPKSLIRVEGFSAYPAKDIIEKLNIKSSKDKELLEKATKEIYSKEFYNGVLKEMYEKYQGRKVSEVKEELVKEFIEQGIGIRHYILPKRFQSRYGGKVHVKIVSDQWFLKYSDKKWKELAHECIDQMTFYPPELKQVFHQGIDWLKDWACTHKGELGTFLPWDREWTIESLSDSTIYMAYYIVAKYLQHSEKYGIDIEKIDDAFFDYVFLGEGDEKEISKKLGIEEGLLKEIRKEFEYWYPLDIRLSAKDLINNHLLFFILHHVAIFPKEYWPKSIAINGHVLIDGKKMSKSKGNFITILDLVERESPDIIRFLCAYSSDSSLDDANMEISKLEEIKRDLADFYRFAESNYSKGKDDKRLIDEWFSQVINKKISEAEELYNSLSYRTLVIRCFYEFRNLLKKYLQIALNLPNKEVINRYILAQTLILYPIVPHLCSEILERIEGRDFALNPKWPEREEIRTDVLKYEEFIERVKEDIGDILKILGKSSAEEIKIIVSGDWKFGVFKRAKELMEKKVDFRELVSELIKENREKAKEIPKLGQKIIKDPKLLEFLFTQSLELKLLEEAKEYLEKEFGSKIRVEREEESKEKKASQALPGKPAIVVI